MISSSWSYLFTPATSTSNPLSLFSTKPSADNAKKLYRVLSTALSLNQPLHPVLPHRSSRRHASSTQAPS
ncbi:hypothetical protein PSPO01_16614 [Paraphaeosphaeria sporulosa]